PARPRQAARAAPAPVGLFDGQLELGLLVGPGHRPGRPAASEQAAEQVLQVDVVEALAADEDLVLVERPAASGAARRPPARPSGPSAGPGPLSPLGDLPEVGTEAVVAGPGAGVGEHMVGLVDLLEPLLGARVLVHVGVVAAGPPARRPLARGGGAASGGRGTPRAS